jgi:hypothetical protein
MIITTTPEEVRDFFQGLHQIQSSLENEIKKAARERAFHSELHVNEIKAEIEKRLKILEKIEIVLSADFEAGDKLQAIEVILQTERDSDLPF